MSTSTTSQPGSSSAVAPTRRERREELHEKIKPLIKVVVFEQKRPYTMVKLELVYRRAIWYGVGFTKVAVPDKWDPVYGRCLAATKARADIVRQIMAHEDEEAKDNDE